MRVQRLAGDGTRITLPQVAAKDYEREITIKPQEGGRLNVAVQLFGHNGPLGAGLTLSTEGAGELVAAIGRALASPASARSAPEQADDVSGPAPLKDLNPTTEGADHGC